MADSVKSTASSPLGHASPDRYQQGAWPTALLHRMAFWVNQLHQQGRLLDLGCGEGVLLESVDAHGIGADLNLERLALAAEKGLSVVHADGCHLPFADGCFDTVVCMEMLEHVPDMEALIAEVARVLQPGGYWIISVPNVTLRSWYEMWRERRAYYCDENEHYREFTPVGIPWFENRFQPISGLESQLGAGGFDLRMRDGVRYLFPQWFSRIPVLQATLESPTADRFWSALPWVRCFSYWAVLVLRKADR